MVLSGDHALLRYRLHDVATRRTGFGCLGACPPHRICHRGGGAPGKRSIARSSVVMACHVWYTGGMMERLIRFLNRPVTIHRAHPQ